VRDVLGQPIDVEDMGIEVVREHSLSSRWRSWLGSGDGLEEFGIAPGTADVLGRAAALGFDQAWVKVPGSGSIRRSTLMVCSQPSPKS